MFIAFSFSSAFGKKSVLRDVLESFGFIPNQTYQSCPDTPQPVHLDEAQDTEKILYLRAQKERHGFDKCKAAEYYWELILRYPGGKYYQEAYRSFIENYISAKDYFLAINEANVYLDNNKGLNDSEYIHMLLIKAVHLQINDPRNTIPKKTEFLTYALGANMSQVEDNPYLLKLKYKSFIDTYPKSVFIPYIQSLLNEARQEFGKILIQEANAHVVKMEYPQAVNKYNMILKWGPVLNIFSEAIYKMIEVNLEFAWILNDPKLLPDYKVLKYLGREMNTKITLEERKELAKNTYQQAIMFLEQMKKHLPNNPWTTKAERIVKNYVIEW